jgi:Tfp pilus assembly protein PilF
VSVVAVLALLVVARAQIASWQNTETLFRRAIAVTDGNRTAHYNLAWYLARQKRPEEAIEQYESAIEIDPTHFPCGSLQ